MDIVMFFSQDIILGSIFLFRSIHTRTAIVVTYYIKISNHIYDSFLHCIHRMEIVFVSTLKKHCTIV